ncbi:MAG: hypothetical protein ACLF0P_05455 [Thermoanaerobaculia bacterium]
MSEPIRHADPGGHSSTQQSAGPAGHYPAPPRDPRQKSPFLAGLLSVVPGLGQVYVGYYQRGFIHAVVIATLISFLAATDIGPLVPLAAVFLGFFWLYNIVDAGRRASLYNQALAGLADIQLPEDFKPPSFRGSVAGGLAIAALGVILLLHTRFDVSLEWVGEWWPAALILGGAYLVWKAWQDRTEGTGTTPETGDVE